MMVAMADKMTEIFHQTHKIDSKWLLESSKRRRKNHPCILSRILCLKKCSIHPCWQVLYLGREIRVNLPKVRVIGQARRKKRLYDGVLSKTVHENKV